MIRLREALNVLGTRDFKEVLRKEIEHLDAGLLPLQQGLAKSSQVGDRDFSVMILGIAQDAGVVHVTAGILYSGIIAGCSCADDPTPVTEQSEYCEIRFDIDRQTAETTVTLLPDPVEGSG